MSAEKLFNENQGIVDIVAKTFSGYLVGQERAITFDDLRSVGLIALHLASQSYDQGKQVQFDTYASTCISRAMSKLLYQHRLTIRHPRRVLLGFQKVTKLLAEQSTTVDELLHSKQITSTERDNYHCFTSITHNQQIAEDVIDDNELEQEQLQELELAIRKLKPIQQLILKKNFGIGYDKKMTCEEIGKELGLEKGAVSQRKITIMKKLKKMMSDSTKNNPSAGKA